MVKSKEEGMMELVTEFINATKLKAPSANETMAASAKITKQMAGAWVKMWYEIITNFPEDAKKNYLGFVFVNNLFFGNRPNI